MVETDGVPRRYFDQETSQQQFFDSLQQFFLGAAERPHQQSVGEFLAAPPRPGGARRQPSPTAG